MYFTMQYAHLFCVSYRESSIKNPNHCKTSTQISFMNKCLCTERGLERWSAVKSSGCSCRGPTFNSQHLPSSSQTNITTVPGNPVTSFNYLKHQTYM